MTIQELSQIADIPYGIWQGEPAGQRPAGTERMQRVRMKRGRKTLRVAYMGDVTLSPDWDDDYDDHRGGRQTRLMVIGWRALDDRPEDLALYRAYLLYELDRMIETLQAPPDDERDRPRIEQERTILCARRARLEAIAL